MRHYRQLTPERRYQIESLLGAGLTQSAIAAQLNCSQSTISRELSRNKGKHGYAALRAQQRCQERHRSKPKRKKDWEALRPWVSELLERGLTPERIAACSRKCCQDDQRVSHEWLYLRLRDDARAGGDLWRLLVRGKKRRRPRLPRQNARGQITGRVSITERPAEVAERSQMGHWEVDTVVSAGKKTAVVTAVERKSRLYVTRFVPDRCARTVCRALVAMLEPWQEAGKVKTLTADNGKEFAEHAFVADALQAAFYFADPYASWQRGSNEHHNGLLRRFFPKGTDFALVSAETLDYATLTINSWPRKNLKWETPLDMMLEYNKQPIPSQ
jgi:IS30 family transposase